MGERARGTGCAPSPGPLQQATHNGRDGSSSLLQLFQVQRLLRRGVEPGVAGGVEQAGPGGQQPGTKTRTSAMGRLRGPGLPHTLHPRFVLPNLEDILCIREERAGPLLAAGNLGSKTTPTGLHAQTRPLCLAQEAPEPTFPHPHAISSKSAVVQNKPEGEWTPELGVTEQVTSSDFIWTSFYSPELTRRARLALGIGSHALLQGLSFIKVLKPGQATTCRQLGRLGHLKDERLDLDGIWYSAAQQLCSPAPSPLALPLGCLSRLVDTQPAVQSPCANMGGIPMVPPKQGGMEVCKAHRSNPQCVQLPSLC